MVRRRQIGPCSEPGCGTPIHWGYVCEKHYLRIRRHGDASVTLRPRNSPEKPCAFPGCDDVTTRTYCLGHEWRLRRYGSVEKAPPRGRKSYQGPCSTPACGRVGTRDGLCPRCARIARSAKGPARPMLTLTDIADIRLNPNRLPPDQLAGWKRTTASTVIAVQKGRNWGFLRS